MAKTNINPSSITTLFDDFTPRGRAIPDSVRQRMSILPPRNYDLNADPLPFPDDFEVRYIANYIEKQRIVVAATDWMDDSVQDASRYSLMMRGISNDADLVVICEAARHLCFISEYNIVRGKNLQLGPEYERDWVRIDYRIFSRPILVDPDASDGIVYQPVLETAANRRKIWQGLIEAAGYRVRDGAIGMKRITPRKPNLRLNEEIL